MSQSQDTENSLKLKLCIEAVKAHDYIEFLENMKVYYQDKYNEQGFINDPNTMFFKKLKLFIDEELKREREFVNGVFNDLCPHPSTNGKAKDLFKVTKRW